MYAYFRGKLMKASPLGVVLDVNQVGYFISIPASVYPKLPKVGEEILLYTSFVVRELSQALYGFLSSHERDLFEGLMGITGIGPKVALSIIGHLPMKQLQSAISKNDIATLSKVPGIGKKTAERLLVEMRDKLPNFFPQGPSDFSVGVQDVMNALINLGYNQTTAQRAVKKTLEEYSEETDLATLITAALKCI